MLCSDILGFISQQLAVYCKEVVGVDASANMVAQYNLKVANQGIPPTEMWAICSALTEDDDEAQDLLGEHLDVIVVSVAVDSGRSLDVRLLLTIRSLVQCVLGYHHFEDIADVTRRLAKLLKPGSGVIIVVDHLRSQEPSESTSSSSNDNDLPGHNHGSGTVAHPGGKHIMLAYL